MAAITSPIPGQIPQLRSLNILRDLPAVEQPGLLATHLEELLT